MTSSRRQPGAVLETLRRREAWTARFYVNGSLAQKAPGVATEILSARKREVPDFWNIRRHHGGTSAVRFLANSDRLLSGGYDGVIRIWNSRTGELLLKLSGHTGPVMAVCCRRTKTS